MPNEFDTIRAMYQLDEDKTLAKDNKFKVVETKNGSIRFEFKSGNILMTRDDFIKMRDFMNKNFKYGTYR